MKNRLYLFKRLLLLRWLWCVAMVIGPYSLAWAVSFPPDALPGLNIGGALPGGYEPSGAVWHSRLDRLFVVSDNGKVSSMKADGSDVVNRSVGGDLEGITVADYDSDLLYLAVEHPDSIWEFDLGSGSVTRTFDLTPWMTGPSNSGLEALTFVPDASNPEGGLFYAGLQANGNIYKFELPIQSSTTSTTVVYKGMIEPVSINADISGLHYDVDNQVLYAVFDSYDRMQAMHADGTFIKDWILPGDNQEGIVLDAATNNLFIAEDSGRVMVYSPFPAIPEPLAGDFDEDGDVDAFDFAAWQANYHTASGATHAMGDANGDGDVDAFDFSYWQIDYPHPPPPEPAPEPATLAVFGLGAIAFLLRRRCSAKRSPESEAP